MAHLLLGIGIVGDILALGVATNATRTQATVSNIVVVTISFAVLSEPLVDHPRFDVVETLIERAVWKAR